MNACVKKSSALSLSNKILIRKEGDSVFLYNRINHALLKLSEQLYEALIDHNDIPKEKRDEIEKILSENGMLLNSVIDMKSYPKVNKTIAGQIYKLKSTINPFTILWAVTPKCNLNCLYCFPEVNKGKKKHKQLSHKSIVSIAEQIIEAKVFEVILSGGEVSLYVRIVGHCRYFK